MLNIDIAVLVYVYALSTGSFSIFTLEEGQRSPMGHRKNFVGHIVNYAGFDIKPTYDHKIFIPNAHKFHLGAAGSQTSD